MSSFPLKISLITVSFNSVKTIKETLLSVSQQDYSHVEYIVIDGGSTDGTIDVIEAFKHHIHTFVSEPDEGLYDAMNKGIRYATGDVVGFLHSDDIFSHSNVISQIMATFQNSENDACYGDLIYFSQSPDKVVRYWRSSDFVPGLFKKGWNPPHPTFYVRKNIYEKYGVFDTTYSMGNDIELMMRFLEKNRIKSVYLPHILVKMRLGGISNRQVKGIIEQNKNILRAARNLGVPIFPLTFFGYKLLNRIAQFFQKPGRVCHHVK